MSRGTAPQAHLHAYIICACVCVFGRTGHRRIRLEYIETRRRMCVHVLRTRAILSDDDEDGRRSRARRDCFFFN